MKCFRLYIVFLVLLLAWSCVGWVDRSTVDTYTGTIVGSSFNGYRCEFYLNDYVGVGLSDTGYLSSSTDYKYGFLKINNLEVEMRLTDPSPCQMFYNNQWVDFDIIPDQVPTYFPYPVFVGLFAVLILLFFLFLLFYIGIAIITINMITMLAIINSKLLQKGRFSTSFFTKNNS